MRRLAPGLPQPVQLAISSGTLTAVLTLVILPRVANRIRPWLFRGAPTVPATHRQLTKLGLRALVYDCGDWWTGLRR